MVQNDTGAMMYLERFGYLSKEDMSPEMGMKEAKPMLMAFQKMCNINQTGELDTKTMEMMNVPRCGNLDMVRISLDESELSSNRIKRFMVNQHNLKWRKREVTYKLGMYSCDMEQKEVTKQEVLEAIEQAFFLWSEVTNLDFVHRPHDIEVDIELSFTTRDHIQDAFPFDGPGKVLAHAFPPGQGIGGDVHFEDEENWRVHSPKGTDVLFVATHEIGHALGLSHSSTKNAIMGAFYGGYRPQLKLHEDDIQGIQAIYGRREIPLKKHPKPYTKSTAKPGPKQISNRCRPEKILPPTTERWVPPKTTSTTVRTTQKWLPPLTTPTTTERWIPPKTTRQTTPKWEPPKTTPKSKQGTWRPDICTDSKIDAITTIGQDIYVFKDSYVFQIDSKGEGVVQGWPHHIGAIFPGLETNIDAAGARDNGKVYFFKGKFYWRYTGTKMDPGYPKKIAQHFPGIPDNVDSAFVLWGDKFWRFNPTRKPHVSNIYPLPLDVWGGDLSRIDAAFKAPNDEVYFFEGSVYHRLDQRTFKIAEASPPYPRSSKLMWFGCTSYRPDYRNIRRPVPLYYDDNDED